MAKLTAAGRKQIPTGSFALPGRRYPINDAAHARNALARGAQHASSSELATIKSRVKAKFPGIQVGARLPMQTGLTTGESPAFPKPRKGFAASHTAANLGGSGSTQMGARMPGLQKGEAEYHRGPRQIGASMRPYAVASSPNLTAQTPPVNRFQRPGVQYGARMKEQFGAHEAWGHQHGAREDAGEGAGQYGARMPRHMHALTLASATHLHRAGHISKPHMQQIHSHAKNAMAAMAPPPMLPTPGADGGGAPPGGVPDFGSLAPPPGNGGGAPPMGGGPPPMQMGARMPPRPPPAKKYPKYGAEHYMSTPTPVGAGETTGGQSAGGGQAGARKSKHRWLERR
jgi:hypothetical protein